MKSTHGLCASRGLDSTVLDVERRVSGEPDLKIQLELIDKFRDLNLPGKGTTCFKTARNKHF